MTVAKQRRMRVSFEILVPPDYRYLDGEGQPMDFITTPVKDVAEYVEGAVNTMGGSRHPADWAFGLPPISKVKVTLCK